MAKKIAVVKRRSQRRPLPSIFTHYLTSNPIDSNTSGESDRGICRGSALQIPKKAVTNPDCHRAANDDPTRNQEGPDGGND